MHGRHLTQSGEQLVEESLARAAMHAQFDDQRFTERERTALRYADQMWKDHHNMTDDLFAEVMRVFNPEEIIELGMAVANYKGMGQMMAMLGLPAPATWTSDLK